MTAPTAAAIIRALERQRHQSDIAQLSELDGAHSEAVRAALFAVPRNARIDVRLLLDSVRRQIAARAEAASRRQPDVMAVLRYGVTLVSEAGLEQLAAHLRSRAAAGATKVDFGPGSVAAEIMSRPDSISVRLRASREVERDEIDEPHEKSRTRRVRTRRSRGGTAETAASVPLAPTRREKMHPRVFGPRVVGAGRDRRPFGCPTDVDDFDDWRSPRRPPWLVVEGDEASPT